MVSSVENIKILTRIVLKMKTTLFIMLFLLISRGFAQGVDSSEQRFVTDREAKEAVYMVVKYSGLYPDFIVLSDPDIKSAIAYVKNKKRYIKYNPKFIQRIVDTTETDWAAISILAHEIGHHLLGHTLKMEGSNPGDELAADKYSGFVLNRMGCSLEDSKKAMLVAGHDHGTETHPPKRARLDAIEQGWREAQSLDGIVAIPNDTISISKKNERFQYQIEFVGDNNRYFVAMDSSVVWFDNFAEAIVLGKLSISQSQNYRFVYQYRKKRFLIDWNGNIWSETTHDSYFIVGEMRSILTEN